ncbi:hypothetical protein J7T55_000447 [Diaporthe amygdali]|uniref:uncharacterized protein n=1 Tax=Phomopsis amygdali TaxID=1214568 RepID=UPI0022FDCDBB|nr:uncharacterized protein J7T55_000447 [Diaporthe amygdali]KAJ0103820.1 hypothetical protein J7T55_000447 [Diaporthe amygdali]
MSAIPARYDPRVVVIPCAPGRVPDLPVQILYLIAQELPQPKSVFNLAIASKGTWDYLQPALYQCEVTYEARLIHKYGGGTSEKAAQSNEPSCHEQCGECQGRINLDDRTFESPAPENLLCTDRRITALHWASMQGESALPVALKAIRSALKHQPSYIDAGHVAIQYGNTEVLELLLRNGLNIKLGRLALIHFAVMEGNLAAVKALLNHDPSLIHKRVCRQDGFTLIQTLSFMKQKAGSEDKWNQQLRDMNSYLLERGAVLDAEAGNYAVVDLYWNQSDFEDGEEHDGEKLTALQIALNYARYLIAPTDAHRAQVFTALHAAEVFISMGADWRRQLPSDPSQRGILGLCLKRTVELYEDVNSEEPGLFKRAGLELCDETEMSLYRETRRAWGRVLKAIVENAALPQDEMALSTAFTWLTHRCGNEAHGRTRPLVGCFFPPG